MITMKEVYNQRKEKKIGKLNLLTRLITRPQTTKHMNKLNQTESPTAKSKDSCTPSFLITIFKADVINHVRDGYERWHNYAVYHNQNNGERATKVLNGVIFDILQDPAKNLFELLHKMAGQFTELDMLVLQTIKDRSFTTLEN